MGKTSESLEEDKEKIDRILDKPRPNWSDQELEYIINWVLKHSKELLEPALRRLPYRMPLQAEEDVWGKFCAERLLKVIDKYDPTKEKSLSFLGFVRFCFIRDYNKYMRDKFWPQSEREVSLTSESEPYEDGFKLVIADEDPNTSPETALETTLDLEEFYYALKECLKKLPETYREVFILHYINKKSVKEIVEELKVNEELVKVRLFRARQKLRECPNLKEYARKKGWGNEKP